MNTKQQLILSQRLKAGKWAQAVNLLKMNETEVEMLDLFIFLNHFDIARYALTKSIRPLLQSIVDGGFANDLTDVQRARLCRLLDLLDEDANKKETNWQSLCMKQHEAMKKKGFWDTPMSDEKALVLIVSEVMEAVEADRKGHRADRSAYLRAYNEELNSDPNPVACAMLAPFRDHIKDTLEDEIADACLRICDLAGSKGMALGGNIEFGATFEGAEVTDYAWHICKCLTDDMSTLFDRLNEALSALVCLSDSLGINLGWHIREKMKYNALRPKRHGKKY